MVGGAPPPACTVTHFDVLGRGLQAQHVVQGGVRLVFQHDGEMQCSLELPVKERDERDERSLQLRSQEQAERPVNVPAKEKRWTAPGGGF